MSIAACPPAADLESLFLGGLPEADACAIEQHVQGCSTCAGKLAELLAEKDSLADSLSRARRGDAFSSSPLVADLVKQLKALRPPGSSAAAGADDWRTVPPTGSLDEPTHPPLDQPDATLGVPPQDDADGSLTDFLAPPLAADELGRLGEYRILKILGHGGMGVVFLGEDVKLGRKVAIKAMLPHLAVSRSSHERFLREAKAAAALEHDHIVPIFHVGADRGAPYIVMPLLKGEPLDERLKRPEPMPLADILRIGREVARGLDAAHKSGLIHRDIKPANIWLEAPEDRVKILDFGLARAATQDAGLTQQGAIVGTPAYMAPEQARGETLDARCDLFSLGVVLYRLCTGLQPFQGKDTVSTLMAVTMHEPTAPIAINPKLPLELSELVMKLLAKDAEKRIGSAAEVVQALQSLEKMRAKTAEDTTDALATAVIARAPDTTDTRSLLPAAPPPRRRSVALLAVAAGFGLLALGAGAVVFYWQTNYGTVVIDINDPAIKVSFDNKPIVFADFQKHEVLKVAPGEFDLHVQRGDLEFDTDKPIVVRRGDAVRLNVTYQESGRNGFGHFMRKLAVETQGGAELGKKEVSVKPPPKVDVVVAPPQPEFKPFPQEVWHKEVAALPPAKQVSAVSKKMKDRNTGFDGKLKETITGDVVTGLEFITDNVTDLSPLRALPGLKSLKCGGTHSMLKGKGKLVDLAPLKDMKLTVLHVPYTKVWDLRPLKDMPLTELNCHHTKVADLVPLKGMKLTTFDCGGTTTAIVDFSPLRGMPLIDIRGNFMLERDADVLRSLTTLETINGKAAKEFFK